VTDQPSQQPPDEAPGDVPAHLAPDAPTEVRAAGQDAATPPPAFGTTEPGPNPYESGSSSLFPADHPEYAVGAAFGGGLVLALILKRLAH
jgi:hypothetical protein